MPVNMDLINQEHPGFLLGTLNWWIVPPIHPWVGGIDRLCLEAGVPLDDGNPAMQLSHLGSPQVSVVCPCLTWGHPK